MLCGLEDKILNAELLENDRRAAVHVVRNLEKLSECLKGQVDVWKQQRIKKFTSVTSRTIDILCDPDPSDSDIFEMYCKLDKHSPLCLVNSILYLNRKMNNYEKCRRHRKVLLRGWCILRKRYPIKTLRICASDSLKKYLETKKGKK